MLSRFNNEVLRYGPNAVVPRNLADDWLIYLQEQADAFLDANFDIDECRTPSTAPDTLLAACVAELLRHQGRDLDSLQSDEQMEMIILYSLALTVETAAREADIGIERPTRDTLLSWKWLEGVKAARPEFISVLEQACVMGRSKRSWLQHVFEKLLGKERVT